MNKLDQLERDWLRRDGYRKAAQFTRDLKKVYRNIAIRNRLAALTKADVETREYSTRLRLNGSQVYKFIISPGRTPIAAVYEIFNRHNNQWVNIDHFTGDIDDLAVKFIHYTDHHRSCAEVGEVLHSARRLYNAGYRWSWGEWGELVMWYQGGEKC